MIMDDLTTFSKAQVVTASAASTSYIDISAGVPNIGVGYQQLYLVIALVAAMTDGGSDSTVTVSVQSDDNTAFGSATTVYTDAVFAALAKAGTAHIIPISPGWTFERYLRLYYTVANGDLTTGKFTAFITDTVDLQHFYPVGYTVS